MKKLPLLFFLFISLIILNNCKKKDPVTPDPAKETTVAEDKQNITNSFNELSSCITQMRDGQGVQTIVNFLNLDNGEALNEEWVVAMVDSLGKKLDFTSLDDSKRFDFSANAGIYTWNFTTEDWDRTTSDKIIVHFPSDETKTTNNSTLTFSTYVDEAVTIDGEDYFLPKSIQANLTVDNVEVLKLNATAAYSAPIPTNVNISVILKPFTYTISGNRIEPTKFSGSINITNGSGCNTSIVGTFEFTHSDYYTLDMDTDLKTITATITHNNLKIISSADMLSLNAINDPTEEDINTYVKTNVTYNDAKVGELQLYEDANMDTKVRIIYKDGSMEDTEVYYLPFIEQLETILGQHGGDINL